VSDSINDARRSWRDIAETVDLSPPAVADRVDRLEDLGVIDGFTVDLDRSKLREGTPVLVTVEAVPGAAEPVSDGLAGADRVEHVFTTADGRVVFTAIADDGAVRDLLAQNVELADVREFDVSLLSDRSWSPSVEDVEVGLTCDECGNTVTSEGESERLDGEPYHFCCDSCRSSFVDMYENLRDGAET
jgi:DNA-binding Lrp family transcriptional regulator